MTRQHNDWLMAFASFAQPLKAAIACCMALQHTNEQQQRLLRQPFKAQRVALSTVRSSTTPKHQAKNPLMFFLYQEKELNNDSTPRRDWEQEATGYAAHEVSDVLPPQGSAPSVVIIGYCPGG